MELKLNELRIYYNLPGDIVLKLDDEIKKVVEKLTGLKFWASGFDLGTGVRDICFDKEDEE